MNAQTPAEAGASSTHGQEDQPQTTPRRARRRSFIQLRRHAVADLADRAGINAGAERVWRRLIEWADHETGECRTSITEVAELASMSRNTATRAVRDLEAAGLISCAGFGQNRKGTVTIVDYSAVVYSRKNDANDGRDESRSSDANAAEQSRNSEQQSRNSDPESRSVRDTCTRITSDDAPILNTKTSLNTREKRVDRALDRLAELDVDEAERRGVVIGNTSKYLAACRQARAADHADRLHKLARDHPDWTADRLAEPPWV